jgi:hypothetical protein
MTGEQLKAAFATACRDAGYLVLSHADRKHGPAEGLPDLLIIGRWCGRWACVFLEFKSAREQLRPAQVRFHAAAAGVVDRGFVCRVVRQTPEAPGEMSAKQAAAALGLGELMTSLPKPGPAAVCEELRGQALRTWIPTQQEIDAMDSLLDIGDPEVMGRPLSQWAEPARSRLREQLLRDAKRRQAAGGE